jgi:Xaa-Pro aminopeptidase
LREELAKRGLDGFVVPHSDQHMGEYLPAYAERLAWLTAFTGSAGAAVVLERKRGFVDGRYTLAGRNQTDTKLFEPRDFVAEGRRAGYPIICRTAPSLATIPGCTPSMVCCI